MGVYIGRRQQPDPRALAASRLRGAPLAGVLGYPLPGDPPPAGGGMRVRPPIVPPYIQQPQMPPQPNEPRMWPQQPQMEQPRPDPWAGMREVTGDPWAGAREPTGVDPMQTSAAAPQQPRGPTGLLGKLTTPDETIMGLAAGLLDAGRWSTTPINMSEALGQGVKGAMAGKQLKQERKEREDILAFKKRAEDFEQRRIEQWQNLVGGLKDVTPEQRALLGQVGPEQGANLLLAKSMRNDPAANQNLVNIQMPDQSVRTFRQGDPAVDDAIRAGGREIGVNASQSSDRVRRSTQPVIIEKADGTKVYGTVGDDGSFEELPMPEGSTILDPYEKARDTAQGKERGTIEGKAAGSLPKVLETVDYSIDLIDGMLNHPGRETATGLSGTVDPRNYIAGTDATDFNVRRKQMTGRVFLDAFDRLRNAGQITEVEGQKATEAMARLDTAQSDAAFFEALTELKTMLKQGRRNAINMAAGVGGGTAPPPAAGPRKKFNPATGKVE